MIGQFAHFNTTAFHQVNGKGYQFLADNIIEIQSKNPQLAAGLLNPLLYWKRYDASRQALIKAQLIRIFNLANLSKNLYELIQSTLTDNASKKT